MIIYLLYIKKRMHIILFDSKILFYFWGFLVHFPLNVLDLEIFLIYFFFLNLLTVEIFLVLIFEIFFLSIFLLIV
jgi:hypothetical protein